jgi:hypothetical protein
LGSLSIALAQNAPTSKEPVSPNNINKGTEPGSQSGSESQSTATGTPARIAGNAKYCKETSANGPLNCVYASMSACEKVNKANNLRCVANPKAGTTGSQH